MATNYPAALDDSTTIPVESANTKLSVNHVTAHQNIQDAIEAIEAKVGIDGSAVNTSHDYKLSEVTSTDKAVGKSATQTLTNKTLTSPLINLGSDAEGDTYYRNAAGVLVRLPKGTDNHIMKMNGNVPNWEAETSITDASYSTKGIVQGLTDAATSGLTISSGVISVNSGTSANNILKLNASSQIPAVSGVNLTGMGRNTSIYEVVASSNTRDTNSASVNFGPTTPGSYTKMKETVYNDISGVLNVTYTVGIGAGAGTSQYTARLYVNGSAVGTANTGTSGTYTDSSVTVNTGDLIQVYAFISSYTSGTQTYNVSNLLLKCDKQIKANYVAATSNS